MNIPRIHLFNGVLTFATFLVTGLYMSAEFPVLYHGSQTTRFIYRANHVDVLLAGLINLLLAAYLSPSSERWRAKQLLSQGAYFSNAHYAHAITETAPGHATLFTGASPAVHGIIGNSWILPTGGKTTSVNDALESGQGPGTGPAEKSGRSPRLLFVPTLGDELIRQTRGASKVIAVSSKDRSAILPAGYAGRAIWMGERGFVTSSYYGTDAVTWHGHPPCQSPT